LKSELESRKTGLSNSGRHHSETKEGGGWHGDVPIKPKGKQYPRNRKCWRESACHKVGNHMREGGPTPEGLDLPERTNRTAWQKNPREAVFAREQNFVGGRAQAQGRQKEHPEVEKAMRGALPCGGWNRRGQEDASHREKSFKAGPSSWRNLTSQDGGTPPRFRPKQGKGSPLG